MLYTVRTYITIVMVFVSVWQHVHVSHSLRDLHQWRSDAVKKPASAAMPEPYILLSVITLAASNGMRNVTVWRPSARLSVCPLLRAKFHPYRCNVSPLRGEKPQNRPLSVLITGALSCAQCCRLITLYPFLRNSPTGQTRRRIFTHDGSNDADSRKDVPFGGLIHIAPI